MDELLHHWQISLISQGRVWVYPHAHLNTHTDTYECMHTEECVWTRTRSYTHAFYQSNLIGKSMLWLANRELMQSRGLSSSLPPPVSIFTYLSLMSFSSPPVCSLSFSFVSSCGKQLNNICTQSAEADETRPADWWSQQQSFFHFQSFCQIVRILPIFCDNLQEKMGASSLAHLCHIWILTSRHL